MPLYDFRLEAQDGSGHYRAGTIQSLSEAQARATLTGREQRAAEYRLTQITFDEDHPDGVETPTDAFRERIRNAFPALSAKAQEALTGRLLDEGIGMDGFYSLPGGVRAAVAAHHQAAPYKLVDLKEKG